MKMSICVQIALYFTLKCKILFKVYQLESNFIVKEKSEFYQLHRDLKNKVLI